MLGECQQELRSRSLEDQAGQFELLSAAARPMSPAVSVVMSVYNGMPFLDESIGSVLCQSFTDFEFIIVNDGSTDESEALILDRMRVDPRVVLVRQSNIGLTRSLNRAIRLANAPFIARQDADDTSHPERLRKMLGFAECSNASIFACDYAIVSEGGSTTHRKLSGRRLLKQRMLVSNQFAHGSLLMRREHLDAIGYYDESLPCSQDYELLMRSFAAFRGSVAVVPGCFYQFRKHVGSISSRKRRLQSTIAWKVRMRYLGNCLFG